MSSSLRSKSKEDEEDERANDTGPLGQHVRNHYTGVASPEDCWNLPNTTEIIMSVFPANPRHDRDVGYVQDNRENRHGNGEKNFRASQSHQTEVSAGREGRVS